MEVCLLCLCMRGGDWCESLPPQAVRRRFSGPLLLPPLSRRHSCQARFPDSRRPGLSTHNLPLTHNVPHNLPQVHNLARLEVLYSEALASHDELRRRRSGAAIVSFTCASESRSRLLGLNG
ncbi:hypothetical protein WMY93_024244 [Mugilogobius chulae]|uniref:Uncharacterized protein n=1 Tax=Mugilogobius chulae TaxID=88201 RepID=A0AAW0N3I4_9GOBI